MQKLTFTHFPDASADKPSGASIGRAVRTDSFEKLHDFVQKAAWSPFTFTGNERKSVNFEKTTLLATDFDEKLSIKEAIKRLDNLGLQYSITLSRNHLKIKNPGTKSEKSACDRFRIIVPLAEAISHSGTFLKTMHVFLKSFPEADSKCLDVARYFFPSNGKGETFLNTEGSYFAVHETKLTYDDLKKSLAKESKSIKNITSTDFVTNAHTGLAGDFNTGLYKTAFRLAANGKTEKEIIDFASDLAPDELDKTDLRTIKSAITGAAKLPQHKNKKSDDQRYMEETSAYLRSVWKDKYNIYNDEIGNRLILEKTKENVVMNVGISKVISEATKIFSGTPYLRKPGRIKDAVENYLNLIVPFSEMPKSIVTIHDEQAGFNRLKFEFKNCPTPLFDEILGRCTNAPALSAFIFSLFVPRADRQQYVWLFGSGGNGKSAMARFIKRCLGSAYHAERAGGAASNRFYTASFIGKRLAVFSDSNATKFVTTEMFKELSGGDPIKIEFKNQNPFTAILDTKFLFLSNSVPSITTQKSDQRRIIFCQIGPIKGEHSSTYEDDLWEERQGILWKCKAAYEALTKNHGPIKCDVRAAMDLAEDSEIHFNVIFDELFISEKNAQISQADFYTAAYPLCSRYNVKYDDFKNWAIRLHNLKPARDTESDNKRVLRGVKISGLCGPERDFAALPPSIHPKKERYTQNVSSQ